MEALQNSNTLDLWQQFLTQVSPQLSAHVLDNWLRPVRCTASNNGVVVLETTDAFSCDWLKDHYLEFIQEGLAQLLGFSVKITWQINPERKLARVPLAVPAELPTPLPPPALDANTDQVSNDFMGKTEVPGFSPTQAPVSQQLNQRYHFNNFVGGPSNQFALAACQAVAAKPGKNYNPLFIFGGVGLGKTHLLAAIGHHVCSQQPNARIIYASSEQFTNEVVHAVLGAKLSAFRNKYRSSCDIILIDDIQLIAGKERTQHEFFHIFNTLYDSQRQIVVTSDKLPHEMPEIEERLRSRFQWGLVADVQPPEIETRLAILRNKATAEGFFLPEDVGYLLAERIQSNVRELEGALVRIMAHASLTQNSISLDYASSILNDIVGHNAFNCEIEDIQQVVAHHFGVKLADIKSKKRNKLFVRSRQFAMYLCRKHLKHSFVDLGVHFGNKDHSTILHACKRTEKLLQHDPESAEQLSLLEQQLSKSFPSSL